MRFQDIEQLTQHGHYAVDIPWDYIEDSIARYVEDGLDLDPDFQRAHVWDESRQIKFVEFLLRGGTGSGEIRFNCPGWHNGIRKNFVLVDGKQRLEACRKFLRSELPVFDGYVFSDFEGRISSTGVLRFRINELKTRKEVLKWYLEINSGGVIHTEEELEKVRSLLAKESN